MTAWSPDDERFAGIHRRWTPDVPPPVEPAVNPDLVRRMLAELEPAKLVVTHPDDMNLVTDLAARGRHPVSVTQRPWVGKGTAIVVDRATVLTSLEEALTPTGARVFTLR